MEKPYQSKMDDYFSEEYRMKKRLEQELRLREDAEKNAKGFAGSSLAGYFIAGLHEFEKYRSSTLDLPKKVLNIRMNQASVGSILFMALGTVAAMAAVFYGIRYYRLTKHRDQKI